MKTKEFEKLVTEIEALSPIKLRKLKDEAKINENQPTYGICCIFTCDYLGVKDSIEILLKRQNELNAQNIFTLLFRKNFEVAKKIANSLIGQYGAQTYAGYIAKACLDSGVAKNDPVYAKKALEQAIDSKYTSIEGALLKRIIFYQNNERAIYWKKIAEANKKNI